MNKITVDTYKKLITFYKFRTDDYEIWEEMLHHLDSQCITEAVDQWIRTKAKTPTVADIAMLAEEIEVGKRMEKKRGQVSEEARERALMQMYDEYCKAQKKGYVIAVEKCGDSYYKYSWLNMENLPKYQYEKVRRYWDGNEFFVYLLKEEK